MTYSKMISNPLVTIIIPVFNVALYLSQCLDSVIHQTYENLEIIIIDDGSTDESGAICEKYAERDKRIRLIHNDNNVGLATTRNIGLEKMTGSYISFIDSDDWIELNTIELLVNIAIKTDSNIAVGRTCQEYVGKTVYPKKCITEAEIIKGFDIYYRSLTSIFGDVVWNKLYRVECFDDIHFPDGRNYEDVATTWKVMKKIVDSGGSVVVFSEVLFHFRMRNSSISHTRSFDNIVDSWNARYEKYKRLSDYKDILLPHCVISIGQMWVNYCCFSESEKKKANKTIDEMNDFSKNHFKQIMNSSFPFTTKLICLISCFKASLTILKVCYSIGNARRWLMNRIKEGEMYE